MIKNYLKIAWRNLVKRKVFTAINVLGLAIGFGSSILIYLFLNHHLSYDNFHADSERIYRFVTEEHRDYIDYEATVPPAFAKEFKESYGYAEKVAKIAHWENIQLDVERANGKVQVKEDILFAEADFFEIFNYPLQAQLGLRSLVEPNTMYLTEAMAKKIVRRNRRSWENPAL